MKKKSASESRGAEDIASELESQKDKIVAAEKASSEKSENFLTDLDSSVNNTIKEIQNHQQKLESEVNKDFKKAQDAGEQVNNELVTYDEKMQARLKILLVSFALVLLAVVMLLGDVLQLETIYIALLVVVLIVVVALFYRKIRNVRVRSSENIRKVTDDLKKSPSYEKLSSPKQLVATKKSRIESFRQALGRVTTTVTKFLPYVGEAYAELTLLVKYQKKVSEFQSALDFYNLKIRDSSSFFDKLVGQAPSEARILDDPELWDDMIIKRIIGHLQSPHEITNETIQLLYKEHKNEDTRSIFRGMKGKELKNLAKVLFDSGRLARPPSNLSYDSEDIYALIKTKDNFDIAEINYSLSTYLRYLDYIVSYNVFLRNNGIEVDLKPVIKLILEKIDDSINYFEGKAINLAYKFGLSVFKKILLEKSLMEGFAKAAVSIKFNSDPYLRKVACEISSNDQAVPVIRAYFEKVEQKGAAILKDLVDDLAMVNRFVKDKDNPQHKFWVAQLREGMWHDSTASLNRKLFEERLKGIEETMKDAEKYHGLKDVVSRAFEQVKITTIEKAMDAQVFSAYLILSDSDEGRLATLVDKLSRRDLRTEIPPKRRWAWKDNYTIKEIKKRYGVEPRYDFMKFSPGTWVGVLSKGEEFTEFDANFREDLNKMLEVEGEHFNIGLIIQRITPSKYSFGILENAPKNVETKNIFLPRYVAKLARDHTTGQEQASLMAFDPEMNLLSILDKMSIYEMMRIRNDEFNPEEKRTLESPSLKENVLEAIKTSLGTKTYRSLALDLITKPEYGQEVRNAVRTALSKASLRRADIFSSRFVDGLRALALIYEAQRK